MCGGDVPGGTSHNDTRSATKQMGLFEQTARTVAIGVDLGGTWVKFAAVDRAGRVAARDLLETPRRGVPRLLIPRIISKVRGLIDSLDPGTRVVGIGVGVPGLVDFERGRIRTLINIAGWADVPLQANLERALNLPVRVDNDVNAMSLGELFFGAARGVRHAVCVTLGTGVGGGLILDGHLYRGSSFSAGEVGHIPINEEGPSCNCGGVACLECYVGNRAALAEARREWPKIGLLRRRVGPDARRLTLEDLTWAARRGDTFSRNFWHRLGVRIGVALSGVVNLLNPDRIVVGGGMAQAGPFLLKGIRESIQLRAMSYPARHVRVVVANLGTDAGVIGAASLILEGR